MMNDEKQPTVASPIEPVVMWQDNIKPQFKGWYAVNYCWDVVEGSCCGVDYFDGIKWVQNLPLGNIAGPFDIKQEAQKWCDENDISF
jgi:hypothetical protein